MSNKNEDHIKWMTSKGHLLRSARLQWNAMWREELLRKKIHLFYYFPVNMLLLHLFDNNWTLARSIITFTISHTHLRHHHPINTLLWGWAIIRKKIISACHSRKYDGLMNVCVCKLRILLLFPFCGHLVKFLEILTTKTFTFLLFAPALL